MRNSIRAGVFAFAIGAILGSGIASGHSTATYYPTEIRWSASHHTGLSITWRFTPGFPNDLKRDRVIEGFAEWNAVGEPMNFNKLAEGSSGYNRDCSVDHPYHGVFWLTLDGAGGLYAQTQICFHPNGPAHDVTWTYDANENWHGGADDPGANEHDFGGSAAHEAGHSTGWRAHFPDGWDICTGTGNATMCALSPGELIPKGYRTLHEDDIHTFQGAY